MALGLKTAEVPAAGPMSVESSPFPSSVVMPPGHEVKNYGELDSYLKQSDLIHEAFKSRFGTKKGTTATDA